MKQLFYLVLLLTFLIFAFSSCASLKSDARVVPTKATTPTPIIDNLANTEKSVEDDGNSPDCVRAKPEAIIKKEVFPRTNFRLEKNKESPFEYLGYETVEFENGDKLLIENVGCENFTWNFHFETGRFSGKIDDARFWYKTAAELIAQTMKGIREPNYINDQVEALNSYIEKNKQPKFGEEIEVGDGINENVRLEKVKKLKDDRIEIVLSFNTGPL